MRHHVLTPAFRREDERGLFVEGLNEGRWESLLFGSMQRGAVRCWATITTKRRKSFFA